MTAVKAQEREIPVIICSTIDDDLPREEREARRRLAEGDVTFAVVDGITVILPKSAKYIMQDKHQRWYFSEKYPVRSQEDWFPDKRPIQYTDKGAVRLLTTKSNKPWRETRHKTIFRESRKEFE